MRTWVSLGLSCLTKGMGKKDCMGLPIEMGEAGRSVWTFSRRQKPSASWLSVEGNACGSGSVAAAGSFEPTSLQMDGGKKKKKTFELLCLPLQAMLFHDSTAHFSLQSTSSLLVLKDQGVFCSNWEKNRVSEGI